MIQPTAFLQISQEGTDFFQFGKSIHLWFK